MTAQLSHQSVSALRQRMIEDMSVRGFSEATRRDYIRCVRAFAGFIGRAPDTATAEDLRRFQLHQTQAGMQPPSINGVVWALRFFFTLTLDRPRPPAAQAAAGPERRGGGAAARCGGRCVVGAGRYSTGPCQLADGAWSQKWVPLIFRRCCAEAVSKKWGGRIARKNCGRSIAAVRLVNARFDCTGAVGGRDRCRRGSLAPRDDAPAHRR